MTGFLIPYLGGQWEIPSLTRKGIFQGGSGRDITAPLQRIRNKHTGNKWTYYGNHMTCRVHWPALKMKSVLLNSLYEKSPLHLRICLPHRVPHLDDAIHSLHWSVTLAEDEQSIKKKIRKRASPDTMTFMNLCKQIKNARTKRTNIQKYGEEKKI